VPLRGIEGKVAVVTGAASGIGAATARRLSEEGAKVVLVDWNEEPLAAVAASLPGPASSVRADVSREEDVERYLAAALSEFGRADLFHLNAGISGPFAPFTDVSTEDFDRVIAVNLRSVFLGLRSALRQLKAQGDGGAIVTTSSLAGLHGGAQIVPYVAAKHGVVGLTKIAAYHGARFGVRVNSVAPGIFETGLMQPLRAALGDNADAALQAIAEGVPLGRFGDPSELGALVTYLLSDDASYLTGAIIPTDGGLDAKGPLGR